MQSSPHNQAHQMFAQGVAALRGGDKTRARELLARSLQLDPSNDQAWLWLSGALESDGERRHCLEQALALNPSNEAAQRGLAMLTPAAPAQQAEPTSAPIAHNAPPGAAEAAPVPAEESFAPIAEIAPAEAAPAPAEPMLAIDEPPTMAEPSPQMQHASDEPPPATETAPTPGLEALRQASTPTRRLSPLIIATIVVAIAVALLGAAVVWQMLN